MPKIAIIGAGSMVFSRNLMSDILAQAALRDTHFALMDIDAERLELCGAMGRSIAASRGAPATITTTTDRRRAIEGADYVINTVGVGGVEATRTDLLVPEKYGVRQVIGDTLCIGGIFRTLRSLPVVLDMCRDIEQLAPDAQLITYTNPMAMHVLGIARATPVKVVGLCHGIRYTRGRMIALARLAQMDKKDAYAILNSHTPHEPGGSSFMDFFLACTHEERNGWETLAAGINHMAAFLVFRKDGQDMYPWLARAEQDPTIRKIEEVRLELFKRLGYFMTETSGHISEYLPWFLKDQEEIRRLRLRPNAYLLTCNDLEKTFQEYKRKAQAGEPFIRPDEPVSIEYASRIINAMETDTPYVFNGNVYNRGGLIANLPADSCVEVPCLADGLGIHPTAVGALPAQVAAMIQTNINVQDLTVRAILERKREHVYHAAMMDPNTASTLSLPKIWELVDEMIAAHGALMPEFLRN